MSIFSREAQCVFFAAAACFLGINDFSVAWHYQNLDMLVFTIILCAASPEGFTPNVICGSLAPQESKWHLDCFSYFCWPQGHNEHTGRHTMPHL